MAVEKMAKSKTAGQTSSKGVFWIIPERIIQVLAGMCYLILFEGFGIENEIPRPERISAYRRTVAWLAAICYIYSIASFVGVIVTDNPLFQYSVFPAFVYMALGALMEGAIRLKGESNTGRIVQYSSLSIIGFLLLIAIFLSYLT